MSKYAMVDVGEAIDAVLAEASRVPPKAPEHVAVDWAALHRILAGDVTAHDPFPPFPAAILDGFAVSSAARDGATASQQYDLLAEMVTAGVDPQSHVSGSQAVYVTTGAKLPAGTDAVIGTHCCRTPSARVAHPHAVSIVTGCSFPVTVHASSVSNSGRWLGVEKTEVLTEEGKPVIHSSAHVGPGDNVRPIGKDIAAGAIVLRRGAALGPAELGVLATLGHREVAVVPKTVVGVLSTGDELDDSGGVLAPGRIRDSNRTALLSLVHEHGALGVDLGLVRDDKEALRAALLEALRRCDVVVTSGGVSMGAADHIKPILEEEGRVHFGRLNMKPGKPTTFATISGPSVPHRLVFGLPGNPVSCCVTAALLLAPALKKLAGLGDAACMHPQVDAEVAVDIKLDPERPEYHRVRLEWAGGRFMARSTGSQLSSRLLSLVGANGLVCVPQGTGRVPAGAWLPTLLLGPLPAPRADECFHVVGHRSAPAAAAAAGGSSGGNSGGKNVSRIPQVKAPRSTPCTLCVLTVSVDATGGAASAGSAAVLHLLASGRAHGLDVMCLEVRALDRPDVDVVRAVVKGWAAGLKPNLTIVVGGCGLGAHDTVPEALAPIVTQAAPVIAHLVHSRASALQVLAVERPVAGMVNETFVATLAPSGSPAEALDALLPLLPRLIQTSRPGRS